MHPVLPDVAPLPPADIHTRLVDAAWTVEFSSALLNVGDGDFHALDADGVVTGAPHTDQKVAPCSTPAPNLPGRLVLSDLTCDTVKK